MIRYRFSDFTVLLFVCRRLHYEFDLRQRAVVSVDRPCGPEAQPLIKPPGSLVGLQDPQGRAAGACTDGVTQKRCPVPLSLAGRQNVEVFDEIPVDGYDPHRLRRAEQEIPAAPSPKAEFSPFRRRPDPDTAYSGLL